MTTVYKKPQPLFGSSARAACPVCGHVSYSSAGVHPQCAMQAADQIQIDRLKSRKVVKLKASAEQLKRYEKRCPRCRRIFHIRKQTCDCGHSFLFKHEQSSGS